MDRISRTIQICIDIIEKEQKPDGGFKHANYKTTYVTGLILQSLSVCKKEYLSQKVKNITNKGVDFLIAEKNDNWTWNYFSKETKCAFPTLKYPDDNDDTFIILSALFLFKKELLKGEVLANITKNLILTEEYPGGPYKTWITNEGSQTHQDIDIAVNANIAHFLHLQGINLPNLEIFFLEKLNGDFKSPYYPSEIALLYFLSKSVKHKTIKNLIIERINNFQRKETSEKTLMMNALCLSSLLRLGVSLKETFLLKLEVLRQCKEQGCSTEPFCLDPEKDGVTFFCGSKSLTAGFAIEALSLCRETKKYTKKDKNRIEVAIKKVEKIFTLPLIQQAMGNMEKEIILYPFILMSKLKIKLTMKTYRITDELAYVNLLGWVAYKIIDDIIDEGKSKELLPLANKAIREVHHTYFTILKRPDYQTFFKNILNDMDEAQREELENTNLDEETVLNRLGRKSLGHALPSLVLVLLLQKDITSRAFKVILSFWRNYLTAKQLSDDAHDWKEDFEKGISNSTLFFIRRSKYFQKQKEKDLKHLNEIFWNETIFVISEKIQNYADNALRNMYAHPCFKDVVFFSGLASKIKKDAQDALKERKEILEYLVHMDQ